MPEKVVRPLLLLVTIAMLFASGCSEGGGHSATGPGTLAAPARLAAIGPDHLAVTDYTGEQFCRVDKKTLEVSACFAAKGQPTGVAYADYDGGRYYVGNKSVGSVDMFDARGAFLGHVGGRTNLFGRVNDLALDPAGNVLYVLDSKAALVRTFDLDGNGLGHDFGAGLLQSPTALTVDPESGFVYVSDYGQPDVIEDSSVKIFDTARQLVAEIPGKSGGMMGALVFASPQGLFVDPAGNLFFADAGFGQVFVYDASLNLVKKIGERGTGEAQLFYPLDLVVDEPGKDVFVTDNRNGRVIVFRGEGALP